MIRKVKHQQTLLSVPAGTRHSPKYIKGSPSNLITIKASPLMPPLKKKAKKKKRRLEEAALYSEDIGTAGIKKSTLASSFSNGYQQPISQLPLPKDEEKRRLKRMERFGAVQKEPELVSSELSHSRNYTEIKRKKKKQKRSGSASFVGTSTALEKPYLRLTDFPKQENVRPLPILVKSLAHIKSEYVKKEDFEWANEQLKSLRQDLTVQSIRNKFALSVYETHARLLLEHGDLNEFHQCQTMIHSLTTPSNFLDTSSSSVDEFGDGFQAESFEGDSGECLKQSDETADEFYAYGLLYNLVQTSWGELTRLLSTFPSVRGSMSEADAASVSSSAGSDAVEMPPVLRGKSVRHALKVVKAVMHDDYQAFFRLYESPPHLSAYLMDFLVRRVRINAYQRIIASYRPSLSVEHFREALAFEDLEVTRRFLKKNGAKFISEIGAPPFWVDCKTSSQSIVRPPPPGSQVF